MSKGVVSKNVITKPYYKYKKEAFESLGSLIYSILSSSGRLARYGTPSIGSSNDLNFIGLFRGKIEELDIATPSGYTIAKIFFKGDNSYISFYKDYKELPNDRLYLKDGSVNKIKGYVNLLLKVPTSVVLPSYETYIFVSNSLVSIKGYNKDRSYREVTWRVTRDYISPRDYLSQIKISRT